jgi:hypothetical protein
LGKNLIFAIVAPSTVCDSIVVDPSGLPIYMSAKKGKHHIGLNFVAIFLISYSDFHEIKIIPNIMGKERTRKN